ncbi:MAG: hypothetical protein H6618_01465 [Deltaproteobacteria bacterium]|nr:hypothetical protein [Deltaproteobacteria bacterium]
MKRMLLVLLTVCVFRPDAGLALIKMQLFYGAGAGDFTPESGNAHSLSASELGATLLLDPIPLVPVGFGLSVLSQTFSPSVADHGVDKLEGLVIAPEVQAWIPFLPIPLVPYGRVSYVIGAYKASTELAVLNSSFVANYVLKGSGTQVGIGAKFEPIPLPILSLSLLFEVNMRFYNFDDKSSEIISQPAGSIISDTSALDKGKWNSTMLLLGVEAGI